MAAVPSPPTRLRLIVDEHDDGRHEARRARHWDQLLVDLTASTVELSGAFVPILPEHGEAASLCAGWTVADVARHLASGEELAVQALRGRPWPGGSPDGDLAAFADRNVQALQGVSLRDAANRWRQARRELVDLCRAADPERAFDAVPWATSEISRFALVQSRIMEGWIHGWDMRQPLGHDTVIDDRAWWIVDLAVRTIPYALTAAGVDTPGIDLRVDLTGVAGGTWQRTWGDEPRFEVPIGGPAWAFATVAARRFVDLAGVAELVETAPDDLVGEVIVENLRAFA